MVNSAIGASLSENTGVVLKEYVIVKQCISRYSILFSIQGTSQSPLEEVLHQLNKNASYEMIFKHRSEKDFFGKRCNEGGFQKQVQSKQEIKSNSLLEIMFMVFSFILKGQFYWRK